MTLRLHMLRPAQLTVRSSTRTLRLFSQLLTILVVVILVVLLRLLLTNLRFILAVILCLRHVSVIQICWQVLLPLLQPVRALFAHSHTNLVNGTETRAILLREAAVGNFAQWAKA